MNKLFHSCLTFQCTRLWKQTDAHGFLVFFFKYVKVTVGAAISWVVEKRTKKCVANVVRNKGKLLCLQDVHMKSNIYSVQVHPRRWEGTQSTQRAFLIIEAARQENELSVKLRLKATGCLYNSTIFGCCRWVQIMFVLILNIYRKG